MVVAASQRFKNKTVNVNQLLNHLEVQKQVNEKLMKLPTPTDSSWDSTYRNYTKRLTKQE